jgi:NADH-quinone oxidoreductase subunit N
MTPAATPGALVGALLPEITLLVGALVLLLAAAWRGERASPTGLTARWAIAVVAATAAAVILAWLRGDGFTDDGRLTGDGIRWASDLVLLLATAGALALLDAEQGRTRVYPAEMPVLLLLALGGMMVMTAARDLMFLYLGVELMSLAVYVLVGANRRSARAAEASLTYFLLGAFASAVLLYGIALLYGATGDTRLAALGAATAGPLYLAGVALLLAGLAFKIGAVPFHLWTPAVYDGAPAPVTAFMAAGVKTAAVVLLWRVLAEGLGPAITHWHPVLWWLAAATMVVGNLVGLSQRSMKRLLAWSGIAHAGYLLVAVLAASDRTASALLFYLFAYTLATLGAFAVLGVVAEDADCPVTVEDLAGLWHVRPGLAAVLSVCLLALLGFPLAGGAGFFAKWFVLEAALSAASPLPVLAVVLVLASVVSAGYYFGVIAAMFNRPRPPGAPMPVRTPPLAGIVMGVSVTLLLGLGVYPAPATRLLARERLLRERLQPAAAAATAATATGGATPATP